MLKQEEIEKEMFKIIEQGQRLAGTPDGYPGVIAYRLLNYLALQGAMLRVDCPDCKGTGDYFFGCSNCNGYGYVAVEPLIGE